LFESRSSGIRHLFAIFVIMKPATIRKIIDKIATELGELYSDPAEGKSVAELLLADLLHTSRAGLYAIGGNIDDPQMLDRIQQCFERLLKNEPVQYVIGKAWFGELELKVAPGVLIPRPETEELVEWIVENHRHEADQIEMLDIGAGSGCIPLALKKKMPLASISGLDISQEALNIASENARIHQLDVRWVLQDIFSDDFVFTSDKKLIIVSNPPYILENEKSTISQRVKKYEPESALFVPDHDPLLFYKRILTLFEHRAAEIYFEINPLVAGQFSTEPVFLQRKMQLRKDIHGRQRMLLLNLVAG